MRREKPVGWTALLAALFGVLLILTAGSAVYVCHGGGVYRARVAWLPRESWRVGRSASFVAFVTFGSPVSVKKYPSGETYQLGFFEVAVLREVQLPPGVSLPPAVSMEGVRNRRR